MSGLEPKDEPDQSDRSEEEDRVTGYSHPSQRLHQVGLHEFTAAGEPITALDRRFGLQQANWQQAQ